MKKKFFAIILAIAMILTSTAYLSDVSFAEDARYVLSVNGTNEKFDTAGYLLAYMNNASNFAADKTYTLTLNDDLILPVVAGELKSLEISGNITIIGNGKTISGADGGKEKTPLIKFNEDISDKIILRLENLLVDGSVNGENKYQGLNIYNTSSSSKLYIDKTTFKNCLADEGGAVYIYYMDTFEIKNSTFINNKARSADEHYGNGGAIRAQVNSATINNSSFTNSSASGNGGALSIGGEITLSKVTITKNKADQSGGGIEVDGITINIIDGSFIGNNEAKKNGGGIFLNSGIFNIENIKITANSAGERGGGIYMVYTVGNSINYTEISNNHADKCGGGLYTIAGEFADKPLVGLDVLNNSANINGGGMFLSNNGTEFKESRFIGNKAGVNGGAISMNRWGYQYEEEEPYNYGDLTTGNDTIFDKNYAGNGFYNPPKDYENFTNLKFAKYSLDGRLYLLNAANKLEKADSLVNNYDVDYVNNKSITIYDPNGGQGKIYLSEIDNTKLGPDPEQESFYGDNMNAVLERKSKIKTLEETGFTNSTKFLGWSRDKDATVPEYKPGDEVNVKGNLYLYAIWEKPAKPAPSTHILTLDENHRGGEITNIEVEEGDLIEPHLYIPRRRGYIFRGWSYDRKHLDEVKPGDRIYTDTTLYAIWKRAEEEVVEEPIEIKGEDHKAYIFGYPNGSVRPNRSITRAEAAAMLARLLNIEAIGSAAKPQFSDTESSWYNKAINAVVFRGIMKGYPDGRFRPNAPITRAEFTQMISTIDNKPYGVAPFVDVPGHWAERAIGSEYQAKRITGYPDGLFRPDANITRAEAAVILNKIFERNYYAASLLKCKNPQMLKRFTDLDESFWGWNDMVEATNSHEYVRRNKNRVEEDWLLIK